MSLARDEQRALASIEASLRRSDPRLDIMLSWRRLCRRRPGEHLIWAASILAALKRYHPNAGWLRMYGQGDGRRRQSA